jgi:glycosyltransferase involved in cell wall biosynthesis
MRIGQNPAKFIESVPQPARITVAIISYIPFLSGYYTQSLDVLKTCLGSLWAHTDLPYDLLVFDNASCPEVRAWLSEQHETGKIQYLILSAKNLGKPAAWNFIFAAAPGEIIAYADADIYFESGWLSALVNVLDTFPNAGMVTGIPMWSPEQFSTATVEWEQHTDGVTLERGKLLAWDDLWKHAQSVGMSEEETRKTYETMENLRVSYKALQCYIGAGHFQFVAHKSVLMNVVPIPADRPMGQVRRLDILINEKGYLRLSTKDWWVRHMGNTLDPEIAQNAPQSQKSGGLAQQTNPSIVRKFLFWLHHKTFEWLYR